MNGRSRHAWSPALARSPHDEAAYAPAPRVLRTAAIVIATAASFLAWPAGTALAQSDAPHAGANVVVPPQLEADSPASYPEQALREGVRETIEVVLLLAIGANGAVTEATVDVAGGHGFDEAAVVAARGLRFKPASRGGQAIAAKIRFKYAFEPPKSRLVGRVARQATDSPVANARIIVRDAKGVEHTTISGADGAFRVEGLPFGRAHVHVDAERLAAADSDEEVAPGEEIALVLRLRPLAEAPPPPPLPGGEPIEEVRVVGERPPRELTKRTLTKDEIMVVPGTNGDALRSLQNLPGVARPPPFGGQLVVRGSAPQDTQYFFDGTNIPIVYHFGGLSSVIPTELLDKIDFYPGNFGAAYGRGMGGIVDVSLRGPRDDGKFHGMAQLDSIDVRFVAERSLGKGWSFLVGGRRSYFDLYLATVSGDAGISTAPRYYDYQAMIRKEFGRPDHDVRITFLGSDDRIAIFGGQSGGDLILGGGIRAALGFWRVQARYQNRVASGTRVSAVVATGQDFVEFGIGENYIDLTTFPISGRLELSQRIVRQLTVNAGLDILHTPYEAVVRFPKIERPGEPGGGIGAPSLFSRNDGKVFTPGAYADLEIVPFKGTRIVPGYRADYTNITKEWNHSPRIVARQDIVPGPDRTTLKGGVGLFFQPPSPFELDPVYGQPGLVANRSVHYSAGIEQAIGPHAEVSVEGFYKELDRLVVLENQNRGSGRIWGAETLLRWKNDPKLFGWMAYTISRSERRDGPDEPLRIFEYDQTHVFTILASRAWGDGFRLGGRFRVVSGNLYTPNAYDGALDLDRASYQPVGTRPLFGERMDLFHQLDIRFEKSIVAKPLAKLNAYIDVQNIYAHRAQEGVAYNYNYTLSQPVVGLPVLSIIGVRADL